MPCRWGHQAGRTSRHGRPRHSLVELLQGRFSTGVMERLCRHGDGLFPVPTDIRFDCSCPDSTTMCTHVAAVLDGIGARFDHQPELLSALRQVDASALLAGAGDGLAVGGAFDRALASSEVGELFGLEMEAGLWEPEPGAAQGLPQEPGAPAGRPYPRASATPPAQGRSAKRSKPALREGSMTRARPAERSGSAMREQPSDPASLLLTALREHGVLDNATGRAATGLEGGAVRLLLQQLVAQGQARVVGQKPRTRYLPTRR
jgi:hypothetical protein